MPFRELSWEGFWMLSEAIELHIMDPMRNQIKKSGKFENVYRSLLKFTILL